MSFCVLSFFSMKIITGFAATSASDDDLEVS